MIFIGIVGAEAPLAKIVLDQLEQHKEMYRLAFKVDRSYKKSLKEMKYSDVEDALLEQNPTIVLDFLDVENAQERVKLYQCYFVPAIMTAELSEEVIDSLQALRRSRGRSPLLVVQNCLSLGQVMLVEQAVQSLKILGEDVKAVHLDYKIESMQVYDAVPYTVEAKRFNKVLGINENTIDFDSALAEHGFEEGTFRGISFSRFRSKQTFGFVTVSMYLVEQESPFMGGIYDLDIKIETQDSEEAAALHFESSAADIWHAIVMLTGYACRRMEANDGEIKVNLLPQLVRNCWN